MKLLDRLRDEFADNNTTQDKQAASHVDYSNTKAALAMLPKAA